VNHIDQGCIGGVFFEYNDEPFSKADPLQQSMGVVAFSPSYSENGTSSLDPNVWTPDVVTKKDIIFAAVSNGTFKGKPYNLNGNIFELLGRNQSVLPAGQCVEVLPSVSTTSTTGTTGSTISTIGTSTSSMSTSGTTTSGATKTIPDPQGTGTTTFSDNVENGASVKVGGLFALLATIVLFL
jgi:hypothetical protein